MFKGSHQDKIEQRKQLPSAVQAPLVIGWLESMHLTNATVQTDWWTEQMCKFAVSARAVHAYPTTVLQPPLGPASACLF